MMWWFMGQKSGASALSLQRNFGIGSYRTAWTILQKLRSCMVRRELSQLTGDVEVDEIFVGGVNNKEPIAVAAEVRGLGTGRIRLRHIEGRTASQIQNFITESIAPGSKIISDRHKSYVTIVEKGYAHDPKRKAYFWENLDRDDDRLLPRVHRVASLVKRWYYGTYHGRVDKDSLQHYLDEFVFRFNRRTSGSRGLVFHRLIQVALMPNPERPA
jgi:transposase-like protein